MEARQSSHTREGPHDEDEEKSGRGRSYVVLTEHTRKGLEDRPPFNRYLIAQLPTDWTGRQTEAPPVEEAPHRHTE